MRADTAFVHRDIRILAAMPCVFAAAVLGFSSFGRAAESETIPSALGAESTQSVTPDRVSLDYRDADLSSVLRSFSYSYNLNLVTSADVKGKVTVSLTDVTIDEALEALLKANALTFTRRGNIVYINPIASEEEALINEAIKLNYLKAADAQNLVRKALTPKGDIRIDEMTNTIVVSDTSKALQQVKELLTQVDKPPEQVIIEAKIVDITSSDLHNIGVTWGTDFTPTSSGLFNRNTVFQEELQTTVTLPGTSSSLSGGQFSLDTLTLKGLTLTATLDALISDSKANLLASPSIAVVNNQEARIVIGEKVPFKERTQTTTGTTETTRFIDVGTTLRVTPSINSDGYITMRIHPEVSSVSALLDAGPRITTREADTTVRIKEGETIIIAGLIKQEDNRTRSEVPGLGRLPILKYLFGSQSKDKSQTELAVFITPSILRSRAELATMSIEETRKADAYATTRVIGEQGLIATLFQTAEQLEANRGVESRRKPDWFRKKQAMSLYESIALDFPNHPKAADSLYRAAQISIHSFRDFGRAKLNLQQLIKSYPDSMWIPNAKSLLKTYELEMELQQQRTEQESISRVIPPNNPTGSVQ